MALWFGWGVNTTANGWLNYGANTASSDNFYSVAATVSTAEPLTPKERDRKNIEALRREEVTRRAVRAFKAPVCL